MTSDQNKVKQGQTKPLSTPTKKIFISYSHEDEEFKEKLVKQLNALVLEGSYDLWEDSRIETGTDWLPQIEKAIEEAAIAVLMVSADFLTSKFIRGKEVPAILQRREKEGLRVLPLFVKPCAWDKVPWLSGIQGFPRGGRFLMELVEVEQLLMLMQFVKDIDDKMNPLPEEPERVKDIESKPRSTNKTPCSGAPPRGPSEPSVSVNGQADVSNTEEFNMGTNVGNAKVGESIKIEETLNNKLNAPVVVKEGKIEPIEDKINIEPGGEVSPEPPPIRCNFYCIIILIVLAIAAFFVFEFYIPGRKYNRSISSAKTFIQSNNLEKADEALAKAREIKSRDTTEILSLLNEIKEKRLDAVKEEFETLKKEWQGNTTPEEKIKKCREFLAKYQNVPTNTKTQPMIDAVNSNIKMFEIEISNEGRYKSYMTQGNSYFQDGRYELALNEYKLAQKIKDTGEVRSALKRVLEKQQEIREAEKINGDEEFNKIQANLNRNQYLEFKSKYPNSNHLTDLEKRVITNDINLPLVYYWDKPITLNSKGYYEFTFGSAENPHIMIYIPSRKIWIDKYEVSWKQYRRYLKEQGKVVPSKNKNKYKSEDDEFPVIIKFEEAVLYGKEYGFRLPNEDEWEYVAGKGQFTYPWGNESPDAGGVYRANFDTFEDGYPGTAPVRSFEKFASPFGVVNMSGNVWEWVQGSNLKGGGFLSEKDDMAINKKIAGEQVDKWGFRCIKEEK